MIAALLRFVGFLRLAHGPARPARLSGLHETPGDRERRLRVALAKRRGGRAPLPMTEHPLFKGQSNA